jgi:hypothetical protein
MDDDNDRTASLMTPAKLAQVAATAQAPVSPSAFLDRMAADVGHQHVSRLAQLQKQLEHQGQLAPAEGLQAAVDKLVEKLGKMDFAPLEVKGFIANLTGKAKAAGAEFAYRVGKVDKAAQALADLVVPMQKEQATRDAAHERTMVEFDVEYKALDKVIDQGARWLQDMRNQLKTREADPSLDAAGRAQLAQDASRCEMLVGRLKSLRAAAAASQQAHDEARATAKRRIEVLQAATRLLNGEVAEWRHRLGVLAEAATEGNAEGPRIKQGQELTASMRARTEALQADCGQLCTHETTLQRQLAAMGEQLRAAG